MPKPSRSSGFEVAKNDVIGQKETEMLGSAGLGLGILATYLYALFIRRTAQKIWINEVDTDWLATEKAKARQRGELPFVSSNDLLTSWFFRKMHSIVNLMVVNFRSRQPSVLDLSDSHVGNYEANLPYFVGDIETPELIRNSIRVSDGSLSLLVRAHLKPNSRASANYCAIRYPSSLTGPRSITMSICHIRRQIAAWIQLNQSCIFH